MSGSERVVQALGFNTPRTRLSDWLVPALASIPDLMRALPQQHKDNQIGLADPLRHFRARRNSTDARNFPRPQAKLDSLVVEMVRNRAAF